MIKFTVIPKEAIWHLAILQNFIIQKFKKTHDWNMGKKSAQKLVGTKPPLPLPNNLAALLHTRTQRVAEAQAAVL